MGSLLTLFSGRGAVAYTYATWNPADKSALISLSDGDLIATGGGWASVRATQGHIDVDESFEVEVDDVGGGNFIIGVMTAAASLETFCGADAIGWGVYTAGYSMHSGVTNDVTPFGAGSKVLCEIDRTNNESRFYLVTDGTLGGKTLLKTFDISSVVGVALFPTVSTESGSGGIATFGQVALIGPLSAGIREGVYE